MFSNAAISKREDVSPKEGVKEYGDVKFADNKNKKYPINNASHVRAAWNYINKDKNAAKYSASEVQTIKRNIIAAWKRLIDPKGPPSVATATDQEHLDQDREQFDEIIRIVEELKDRDDEEEGNMEKANKQVGRMTDALATADWDESQHPRDENGRFGSGGGGGGDHKVGDKVKVSLPSSGYRPQKGEIVGHGQDGSLKVKMHEGLTEHEYVHPSRISADHSEHFNEVQNSDKTTSFKHKESGQRINKVNGKWEVERDGKTERFHELDAAMKSVHEEHQASVTDEEAPTVHTHAPLSDHGAFSYKTGPTIMQRWDKQSGSMKYFAQHENGPLVLHKGPEAETPTEALKAGKADLRVKNPALFRNTYQTRMSPEGKVMESGHVLPEGKSGARPGSLPGGVTEHPSFKGYEEGHGYKYHPSRTHEMDRELTQHMAERGWSEEKQAHFLVSKSGRHMGDLLSREPGEERTAMVKRDLKRFEKDYNPEHFQ
jgi:hypothetical protein